MLTAPTQSIVTNVPVTALSAVRNGNVHLLFSGQGFDLYVRDLTSQQLFCRERIFENQAIHGIRTNNLEIEGEYATLEALVWGGRLVTSVRIEVFLDGKRKKMTKIEKSNTRNVGDWILDATFPPSSSNYGILLTAHNAIHRLSRSTRNPSFIEDHVLASGSDTFLYSGHLLAATGENTIVACGTVFGEVLLWTCEREEGQKSWKTSSRYVFYGHQGSVFGVCISDLIMHENKPHRILASCSDDRTIMLWDITESGQDSNSAVVQPQNQITGFGENVTDRAYLAKTWGHLSRIWGVYFACQPPKSNTEHGLLISTGEDGVCQQWDLDYRSLFDRGSHNSYATVPVICDRHHSGKNIWSFTLERTEDDVLAYSGGADGQIVLRTVTSRTQPGNVHDSVSFRDLQSLLYVEQDAYSKPSFKGLKEYLVLDSDSILATTESGLLLAGTFEAQDLHWRVLTTSQRRSPLVLSANAKNGVAVFADCADNSLYYYYTRSPEPFRLPIVLDLQPQKIQMAWSDSHGDSLTSRICLLLSFREKPDPKLLWVSIAKEGISTQQTTILLPETFNVSSCLYKSSSQLLLLGSRSGAVAIYDDVTSEKEALFPQDCVRHVHSSDTVTSIIHLPQEISPNTSTLSGQFFLTTGRDGTYTVLRCCQQPHSSAEPNISRLEILHQGVTPISPNVEGAVIPRGMNNETSLVLYGFRSKDFVVWDETKQVQLFSVDCGGAHRSWDFHLNTNTSESGTFIWTKAGHFNCRRQSLSTYQIVQPGGHGREIKAVAVHAIGKNDFLVATGAEDTDIRLFRGRLGEHGKGINLQMLIVAKRHTTGLQSLRFSPCGKFLFSAAGMEELYVWSLHDIPLLGIGMKFLCQLPRNGELSDARVMSIDVQAKHTKQITEFTILAAYSDGKLKAVRTGLQESPDFSLRPIEGNEIDFGALCLTAVSWYDCSDSKESFFMVGATNGFLSIYKTFNDDRPTRFYGGCRIHQSSISSLAVIEINSRFALAVTGGDDNGLAFTIVQLPSLNHARASFRTLLLPKAHAAALTAVGVVEDRMFAGKRQILVATAGNDQKLKLWAVEISENCLDLQSKILDNLQVDLFGEQWTSVADISGLEVLRQFADQKDSPQVYILVVGVGIEIVAIDYPCLTNE